MARATLLFGCLLATVSFAVTGGETERVAVVGDSITHQGRYLFFLQLLHDLKCPDERVDFLNLGISWDESAGALRRFDREILPAHPDRALVMLGMNDVGQFYSTVTNPSPKDLEARERQLCNYRTNMRVLVDRFVQSGIPVTLVTPSPYDQYTKSRGANDKVPYLNEPGLVRFAAAVRELAEEKGCPFVELHRPITELAKRFPGRNVCGWDRVHPEDKGALLMALLLAEQLGVTNLASRTSFDAAGKNALVVTYAPTVSPLPDIPDADDLDRMRPFLDAWNQETVVVCNLKPGSYELSADGKILGTYTADELAKGVDLGRLRTPNRERAQKAYETMVRLRELTSRLRVVAFVHHWAWIPAHGGKEEDLESSCAALEKWRTTLTDGFYQHHVDAYLGARPKLREIEAEIVGVREELRALAHPTAWRLRLKRQ